MFFVSSENIPEGVGFQAFGPIHLLWLLGGLILWVGGCVFYRKLSADKQKIALRVLGAYIFLQEMVKNLVLILQGEFSWGYLPFHLCGINILLIVFDTIKQTKTVRSFLYYFAIPGAALALLFPNWTEMPVWNFFHIHSFTIHILLVLYPLLLVTTGQAQLPGMSQTGYSKYETGEKDIPAAVLIKLADLYKTTTDYLLGRTDKK